MYQITHFFIGLIKIKTCYPVGIDFIQPEYVLSTANKFYPM